MLPPGSPDQGGCSHYHGRSGLWGGAHVAASR